MEELARAHSPYPDRRRRAEQLRGRQPYAAEVLTLYLALLDVQEEVFQAVRERPPRADSASAYAVERVLPRVLEVTLRRVRRSSPKQWSAAITRQTSTTW